MSEYEYDEGDSGAIWRGSEEGSDEEGEEGSDIPSIIKGEFGHEEQTYGTSYSQAYAQRQDPWLYRMKECCIGDFAGFALNPEQLEDIRTRIGRSIGPKRPIDNEPLIIDTKLKTLNPLALSLAHYIYDPSKEDNINLPKFNEVKNLLNPPRKCKNNSDCNDDYYCNGNRCQHKYVSIESIFRYIDLLTTLYQ